MVECHLTLVAELQAIAQIETRNKGNGGNSRLGCKETGQTMESGQGCIGQRCSSTHFGCSGWIAVTAAENQLLFLQISLLDGKVGGSVVCGTLVQ